SIEYCVAMFCVGNRVRFYSRSSIVWRCFALEIVSLFIVDRVLFIVEYCVAMFCVGNRVRFYSRSSISSIVWRCFALEIVRVLCDDVLRWKSFDSRRNWRMPGPLLYPSTLIFMSIHDIESQDAQH
ncbi:hypothetical protein L9F63_002710, partial [Diploptera punctata]